MASAQTIVRSFDGDKGIDLASCKPETMLCGRQPELDVAANGTQVVQVTRQRVSVYDYSGKLLRSTPMSDFIKNVGLNASPEGGKGPFEPHVVFDEFIGRWLITVTCLNDCLLASASADALGPWGGLYLSCLEGGPCLNHDPALHIGFDKNGIYYCGGRRGGENPNTIPGAAYDCFAIPSAEVGAIAQGTAPTHINRRNNMPLDVVPAIDHSRRKSPQAPAFFMAKTCDRTKAAGCRFTATNFPFSWVVDTFTWKGATGVYNAGGSEQLVKTNVGSKHSKWVYNLTCCGRWGSLPQAGSDMALSGEAHRLTNLVQFGSHLYAVLGSGPCTSDCGSQGADTNNILIWVELDCSKPAACVVKQTAKISGPDVNPLFGTVGVDTQGNVGIVAESSTATTDLSIWLWTRRKSDPPNTFRSPTMVVSGTQPYTCVKNSINVAAIGNAAGLLTAQDPLDGTKLWTTEQWSNDATPCVWNTRIVEYQIGSRR